jgi:hypothetical protein
MRIYLDKETKRPVVSYKGRYNSRLAMTLLNIGVILELDYTAAPNVVFELMSTGKLKVSYKQHEVDGAISQQATEEQIALLHKADELFSSGATVKEVGKLMAPYMTTCPLVWTKQFAEFAERHKEALSK